MQEGGERVVNHFAADSDVSSASGVRVTAKAWKGMEKIDEELYKEVFL